MDSPFLPRDLLHIDKDKSYYKKRLPHRVPSLVLSCSFTQQIPPECLPLDSHVDSGLGLQKQKLVSLLPELSVQTGR